MLANAVGMVSKLFKRQSVRYIVNGLLATAVHFGVLTFSLKVLGWSSAGASNLVAAVFGIAASFFGSRYYVFRESDEALSHQALRFVFLYLAIALLHGIFLHLWVDVYARNYALGFLFATVAQMVFSFWGNKVLVFKI